MDRSPPRRKRDAVHRQLYGSRVHPTPRRNALQKSRPRDAEVMLVDEEPRHHTESETHSRQTQRGGGLAFQGRQDPADGMDSERTSLCTNMRSLRSTGDRLIRHQVEHKTSPVRLADAGPDGGGSRRNVLQVGVRDGICLSSFPSDSGGSAENQRRQSDGDPHLSATMDQDLDQSVPGSPYIGSQDSASETESTLSAQIQGPSSEPTATQLTRGETIRRSLIAKGWRADVVKAVRQGKRHSTLKIYDSKWTVFTNWCEENGLVPLEAEAKDIAEYLWHLFSMGRQPSTLKGHRSAIANVFKLTGAKWDPGTDYHITEMLSFCTNERPRSLSRLPKWDLPTVMSYLQSAKFEPLEEATLENLTLKTTFLLALGTAKRVSELHALSRRDGSIRKQTDGSMVLQCNPCFLAKTQLPDKRPQPVILRPLPQDGVPALCPVRALSAYLERTKEMNHSERLLLRWSSKKDKIFPQTLSSWIRRVIREAYESVQKPLPLMTRWAHETRAISASYAYSNNMALSDLLGAVGWTNASTFSNFYLRDLDGVSNSVPGLVPLCHNVPDETL